MKCLVPELAGAPTPPRKGNPVREFGSVEKLDFFKMVEDGHLRFTTHRMLLKAIVISLLCLVENLLRRGLHTSVSMGRSRSLNMRLSGETGNPRKQTFRKRTLYREHRTFGILMVLFYRASLLKFSYYDVPKLPENTLI